MKAVNHVKTGDGAHWHWLDEHRIWVRGDTLEEAQAAHDSGHWFSHGSLQKMEEHLGPWLEVTE